VRTVALLEFVATAFSRPPAKTSLSRTLDTRCSLVSTPCTVGILGEEGLHKRLVPAAAMGGVEKGLTISAEKMVDDDLHWSLGSDLEMIMSGSSTRSVTYYETDSGCGQAASC